MAQQNCVTVGCVQLTVWTITSQIPVIILVSTVSVLLEIMDQMAKLRPKLIASEDSDYLLPPSL